MIIRQHFEKHCFNILNFLSRSLSQLGSNEIKLAGFPFFPIQFQQHMFGVFLSNGIKVEIILQLLSGEGGSEPLAYCFCMDEHQLEKPRSVIDMIKDSLILVDDLHSFYA